MREAAYSDLPEEGAPKATGNIALIGFMGVGKSVVAKELSIKSAKEMLSTDSEIEKRAEMSIRDIFSELGEDEFRSMEREEIARMGQARNKVIDCGGGAVLDEGNVEILRRSSIPVWLWARPETAIGRLGEESGRPLLDVEDRVGLARKLTSGRKGKYAKTARMIISTEGRSAAEVAGMILHETGKSV
jgi:shikimate kinase